MEQINGIASLGVPFKGLRKVSDLIYFDGPLLSHFKNSYGDSYLFYWVDSNETFNRWLVFRVNDQELNSYITKHISLKDLIVGCIDEYIYSVDIDDEIKYHNILSVKIDDLPPSYLPKPDSWYEFTPLPSDFVMEEMLSVNHSGLLEVTFKSSPMVGYGTIHLEAFSPLIFHINEISNGLGQGFLKQKNENVIPNPRTGKKKKLKKDEVLSNTMFEVAGFLPGSFKLILRPINTQLALPGEKTEVDKYCEFFLNFIEASFELDTLANYVQFINEAVINHYEKFLKNVQNFKLEFKLSWINPESKTFIEQKIDVKSASTIIENITKLEYQNSSDLVMRGRFVEINLKTKHYTFQSLMDDKSESRGYFDDPLASGTELILIKFNRDYEVKISRLESKEAGSKEPKMKDKIIAIYNLEWDRKEED